MGYVYTVRGSLTTSAAAPKVYCSAKPASAKPIKLLGVMVGNNAATAAQGVGFQIVRLSVDPTGGAYTPLALYEGAPAASFTALSTITANGTIANVLAEFAFDIVGTYVLWFPPGKEIYATTQSLGVLKNVGADTSAYYITMFIEEMG